MTHPMRREAVRRIEDARLVTGHGAYTDDAPALANELHVAFLRSPLAHGVIRGLDVAAARTAPGVVAVLTIEDLDGAGVRDPQPSAFNPEGGAGAAVALPQPALARDRVRYVGEPVAAVVAERADQALDALERIGLHIDELPAAGSLAGALCEGAPTLWPSAPGNVLGTRVRGDAAATAEAFARAAHRVTIELVNNRVTPVTLEPRGCVAVPGSLDPDDPFTLTVYTGTQGVHGIARDLAGVLALPVEQLRVVTRDVGGGFGMRLFLQGETVVAAHAALRLGRPVRWISTRSEAFLSDLAGRDHSSRAELALDGQLRFIGLRARTHANLGAYTSRMAANIAWFGSSMLTGAYAIPAASVETVLVVSNTAPTDAYRGAGRPEASYLIERLVDRAARELGVCPRELRRRNFIASDEFPYVSALGHRYDSGDYARLLEACWTRAGGADFPARRAAAAGRGRRRGLGLAYYVEVCAAYGEEEVPVRLLRGGGAEVLVGTQSTGQGHETAFAQLVADRLGIAPQSVRVVQGDTARVARGGGTGGSRTLAIAGSALAASLERVVEAGSRLAASMMEAAVQDVVFEAGRFRVAGTDLAVPLAQVVEASYATVPDRLPEEVEAGLRCTGMQAAQGGTYPNGCHLCEVEVDPETGHVAIVKHTIEDDLGRVLNPLLLEGQIVGGSVQGLSQALREAMVYDEASAQPLTGTFMDYGVVRAADLGRVDFRYQEIPSPRNRLGVKGAGEAGTIGAPAALVNAVVDALAPLGVRDLDMPLTPARVWEAIRAVR